MIKAKGICKSFADKKVIAGVDLDIKPGMIFGLLGPSGAGKTSLIRIITGQLVFESGEISVFGKPVSELTGEDKRQIGIMMDDHGVYDPVLRILRSSPIFTVSRARESRPR